MGRLVLSTREDGKMPTEDADEGSSSRDGHLILSLVVVLGIALFILGFVVTVTSLSGDSAVSAGSAEELRSADGTLTSSNAGTLVLGLVLSMAGLVTATMVPAVHFLRSSKGRV
jgi:uncharacterized membrane protein YjgN (DUF898 family)